MNGIKMSDCKFYVDEVKRTVVCVIPYTNRLIMDFIAENFTFPDVNAYDSIDFYSDGRFLKAMTMPYSFMGKAVCAPEDEWDEETGRMIAFSRAKDKCYKSFFRRANLFVQTFDRRLGEMIETFNNFGMKLEDKRIALENKISERVKSEE